MSIGELMEQKYAETHDDTEALIILLDSIFDADNKDKANNTQSISKEKIQQGYHIWKLFASHHKEINPNRFKNALLTYMSLKKLNILILF